MSRRILCSALFRCLSCSDVRAANVFPFLPRRCLIPIIIDTLVEKVTGGNLRVDGYPRWCPQFTLGESYEFLVGTVFQRDSDGLVIKADLFGSMFTVVTSVFVFIDFTWIMCVWSAASIGTPTQPMGRDEYLR